MGAADRARRKIAANANVVAAQSQTERQVSQPGIHGSEVGDAGEFPVMLLWLRARARSNASTAKCAWLFGLSFVARRLCPLVCSGTGTVLSIEPSQLEQRTMSKRKWAADGLSFGSSRVSHPDLDLGPKDGQRKERNVSHL
jgi:hypothetical protein